MYTTGNLSMGRSGRRPVALHIRCSKTFILATICIAVFTDIFLYAVIVPVIPFALESRVGIPAADIQHWVSTLLAAYGGALLISSPLAGLAADRVSNRRLPLLAGLLALMGATIMLCLGRTLTVLIIGRVLQGISAAVVWTVGLALLVDTVGKDSIGQASGYVSLSMSSATFLAPLMGGVVYARVGYFPVYYLCFGMIGLDIVLRLALIEKSQARAWLDPEDTPTDTVTATAIATTTEPHDCSVTTSTPSAVTVGYEPVRPIGLRAIGLLLASRRLLAALLCSTIASLLMTAFDAVLPIHVNQLFGWNSLGAGLIFIPFILPAFIAPVIGYWTDQKGPRWPTTIGFFLAGPPLVLLRLVTHEGLKQIVLLCALLFLIGLTANNTLTPLFAEITHVVAHKEGTHPGAFGGKGAYATAYGLFNTAFAAGLLVGPLWGGFVTQSAGFGTMGLTLGLLGFFAAGVSWCFIGGGIKEARRKRRELGSGAISTDANAAATGV